MKSNIVDPIVSRLLASWQTNLLSLCLCLSLCLSVSLSLSVCLCLSLSLSFSMILSSKVQVSAHRESDCVGLSAELYALKVFFPGVNYHVHGSEGQQYCSSFPPATKPLNFEGSNSQCVG